MLAEQRLSPVGFGDLWCCEAERDAWAHWEVFPNCAVVETTDPAVGEAKGTAAHGLDLPKGRQEACIDDAEAGFHPGYDHERRLGK